MQSPELTWTSIQPKAAYEASVTDGLSLMTGASGAYLFSQRLDQLRLVPANGDAPELAEVDTKLPEEL